MEMETNVLLTTVPRAMEESVGYSHPAAKRWEAIAGPSLPQGLR